MFRYVKWHNNYDMKLGETYEGFRYKKGWIYIEGQLYREGCFEEVKVKANVD